MLRRFYLGLGLGLAFFLATPGGPVLAVDTETMRDAPDLTKVRDNIKAKEFGAAQAELRKMMDAGVQHADVYNLMGFASRKLGDSTTALTFYKKALDFAPDHKGAHEYLGELYVETGDMAKATEQLSILVKLCPSGCEEREDLEKAVARTGGKSAPTG